MGIRGSSPTGEVVGVWRPHFRLVPRFRLSGARPVFTHGPLGPGPRAANFQGWHIKKIEIEVWYAEKKGCPRERNLREIYTENNVGTEWNCRYC